MLLVPSAPATVLFPCIDSASTNAAQVEYEPFIQEHCEELARQLGIRHSKPVEVTTWINWFAFDTMGRLVFGKSFDMLKASAYHPRMEQLEKVKKLGGLLHCGPWTLVMLRNLPLIRHKAREWIDWCAEQVEERRQVCLFPYREFCAPADER